MCLLIYAVDASFVSHNCCHLFPKNTGSSQSIHFLDYPCVSTMAHEPHVPLYLTLQLLSLQSFFPKVTLIQNGRREPPALIHPTTTARFILLKYSPNHLIPQLKNLQWLPITS